MTVRFASIPSSYRAVPYSAVQSRPPQFGKKAEPAEIPAEITHDPAEKAAEKAPKRGMGKRAGAALGAALMGLVAVGAPAVADAREVCGRDRDTGKPVCIDLPDGAQPNGGQQPQGRRVQRPDAGEVFLGMLGTMAEIELYRQFYGGPFGGPFYDPFYGPRCHPGWGCRW